MSIQITYRDYKAESVYDFIENFCENKQYAPTFREIGKGCYMSHATAYRHVKRLVELGYVEYTEGISRSIVIVK